MHNFIERESFLAITHRFYPIVILHLIDFFWIPDWCVAALAVEPNKTLGVIDPTNVERHAMKIIVKMMKIIIGIN